MSAYKPKNTSEEYLLEECRRLERELADLRAELKEQKQIVARAKDASPIKRSPFLRVLKLVRSACMDLRRVANGWLLEFAGRARLFKKLGQVWDLFITDDWVLSEIFNPKPEPKRDRVRVPKPILPIRHPVIAPKASESHATSPSNSPVPEPSPYTRKIFTRNDLPVVEVARFPSDFWEKARSRIQGEETLGDRHEQLIPF